MKRQPSNRSVLLLMEIIIAILFFSIVSAVCLQLFVKSHSLSRSTQILDNAVSQTSSAADILVSSDGHVDALDKSYPDIAEKNGALYLYFDKDFMNCGKSSAQFYIKITSDKKDAGSFEIGAYNNADEEAIYMLKVHTYQQKKL